MVKLRWLRKERRIAKAMAAAVAAWRSADGMPVFKCRANGTKAVVKTFRLVREKDNILIWNAGVMSRMRAGVELHQGTLVSESLRSFCVFLFYFFSIWTLCVSAANCCATLCVPSCE